MKPVVALAVLGPMGGLQSIRAAKSIVTHCQVINPNFPPTYLSIKQTLYSPSVATDVFRINFS